MPANKDLKRLIRARAAKTGESYSTARRHVLGAGAESEHAMQFDTSVGDDGRRLVVAVDPPADYVHMLVQNMDFQFDATGRLVWEYPSHAPGWDTAASNWKRHGPEMLDQIHGIAPVEWKTGLRWIADILDGISADWFLIGSASLAVRGIDIGPGGVDVAMDEASADRLAPHVEPGVMRPIVDPCDWPVATRWGRLFNTCIVEVIGGMHEQTFPRPWDAASRADLDTVEWDQRTIRVPNIQRMLLQARGMFRNDHVRAIIAHRAHTGPAAKPAARPDTE
jgi:hypothetical protein